MTSTFPLRALLAGALLLALTGCDDATSAPDTAASIDIAPGDGTAAGPEPAAPTRLPSPTLCETRQPLDVVEQCQPGQTLVFLPQRWGNEQFPLVAVALGCDLAHQVVITNGGVVCTVKTPVPTPAPAPAEEEPAGPVYRDAETIG